MLWVIKPRSWPQIESSPEAKNPSVFCGSALTFQTLDQTFKNDYSYYCVAKSTFKQNIKLQKKTILSCPCSGGDGKMVDKIWLWWLILCAKLECPDSQTLFWVFLGGIKF